MYRKQSKKSSEIFISAFQCCRTVYGNSGQSMCRSRKPFSGFREILDGRHDDDAGADLFLMAGSIDEVAERCEAQYGGRR